MNTNITLLQLAHCNVQLFITATDYQTWFNFTKSNSAGVQIVDVQLRDVELVEAEIAVEVQLTVTRTNRKSHRRNIRGEV
jgi:hypothetical protein